MKKVFGILLVASLLLGAVILSSGCARAAQRAVGSVIERELAKEGITIEGDGDDFTIRAESEDGQSEMSWGSTDLPEGIPSEVHIYPDMNIVFSGKEGRSSDEHQTNTFQVIAESNDSSDKVIEWHKNRYEGWEDFSTMSWSTDDGEAHMFSAQIGSWSDDYMIKVDMVIAADDGTVNISYAVEERIAK